MHLKGRGFKSHWLKLKNPVRWRFSFEISQGIFLTGAGDLFSSREGTGMFDWKKRQNIYLCGIFLLLGVWGHCSLVSEVDDVICDVIVEDDVIDDVR